MAARVAARLRFDSAGEQALTRCEALEQLKENSTSRREFEQDLSQLIPQPGSRHESMQLRRLREIQGKIQEQRDINASVGTSSSSSFDVDKSGKVDKRRQFITRESGCDGIIVETELYWSGKKLVWSRGGVVFRVFSYEEEVGCACWAWMDSEPTWEKTTRSAIGSVIQSNSMAKGDDEVVKDANTASEFQQIFRQNEIKKGKMPAKPVFRALCVFMPSCLVLYHPHTGQEYIKRLDLDVVSVFPLKIGFFLQRKTETEDRKRHVQARQGVPNADAPLSTLFYLRRPYDELKAIECVEGIRFSRSKSKDMSAKLQKGHKGNTFNEIDEQVIMLSESPPVLITGSIQASCLRIYAYAHSRTSFDRYDEDSDDIKGQPKAKRSKENESSIFGAPLARRSTLDGRFGGRPKMPSRRSSRLESTGNRSSVGGPRSSLVGDRKRTASGAGHSRKSSAGGLTSIFAQSGLLLDEEANKSTDEDDMQEMMQLLDEFDEVGEDSQLQLHRQTPSSRTPALATANRRRISRAINTTNAPPRTPYIKSKTVEERRTSRSRISMPGGSIIEGNPISVAMELSQKDEASKIAMTTTSGDTAMSRGGLSKEGFDGVDSASSSAGLSIFHELGQGFSAMTLLEEVPVAELNVRQISSITAISQQSRGMTLLYLIMPFKTEMLVRQVTEQKVKGEPEYFILRSHAPLSPSIDSQVQAGDALILQSKRSNDLLKVEPGERHSLHLIAGPPGAQAKTTKFSVSSTVNSLQVSDLPTQISSHHSLVKFDLHLEPQCTLTATVMSLCELILNQERFQEIRMAWIEYGPKTEIQDWAVLVNLLLHGDAKGPSQDTPTFDHPERFATLLGEMGERDSLQRPVSTSVTTSHWDQDELARLVEGLNLVAQCVRIDVCEWKGSLPRLANLIATLAHRLAWSTWLDYWQRLVPAAMTSREEILTPSIQQAIIFDIMEYTISSSNGVPHSITPEILALLPTLHAVMEVYASFSSMADTFETMSGVPTTQAGKTAKLAVENMLKQGIGLSELRRMPFALALPLQQAIKQCQIETPTQWTVQAYSLIGREDLAKQMMPALSSSSIDSYAIEANSGATAGHISSRLFPNDYRLKEVKEMLQTSRPIATKGPDASSTEDQDIIVEQQKRVFVSAADRIKSLSVGRGMFSFSSASFKSTEQWKTSPLCLRIRILNNCIIQHREPDADSAEMEWPEFHNGVASALQLAISHDKIESSWLYSQLNKEFNFRHAGLIFGIGLRGQLRTLGKVHAHYYLSSRHTATTIGLLLGISLSFIGSCDPLAKALMSIHLIHTLPSHSRPLKTSMLEQSAALVGLGFVFMASKDRWASRMAFKAIATDNVMTDDSQMLKRECFSLSAAISLGLTCLGQGRIGSLAGEIEKEIIPGLERLIAVFTLEDSSKEQRQERVVDEKNYAEFEWRPDINLSTSPASIALALIYLKSNRHDKAEKMPLPQTLTQLDKIRPDLLLIRAICRSLIMWDSIKPESAWLDSVLPRFLQYNSVHKVKQASESCQMAYWSLRVGSIFAIGLKYAGSSDTKAKKCLLDELQLFQSQVEVRPASYFDKICQQMLQTSINIILTSLSMILAGTGDVEILQHLRRGLYKIDTLRYGNYMATSMSTGMLFLGAGRFTLSTSDSSIAALFIAFYPRYPVNAQDNRCHLQAYRHLWLVAVEARLISTEDIDSGESSRMPVEMEIQRGGIRNKSIVSMPCLLPKLHEVKSIKIASNRYFSSQLKLQGNAHHQRGIIESRKLFVKKKAADLSHDDDKWEKSSLRAKAGDLIGNIHQLPLMLGSTHKLTHRDRRQECQQLRDLIKANVRDKDVHAIVDVVFGSPSSSYGKSRPHSEQEEAIELFILQSMLDCLLQDKVDILPTMISLYASTRSCLNKGKEEQDSDVLFLQDLRQLVVLLREQEKNQDDGNLIKHSLLDGGFIKSLWSLIQDKYVMQLTQSQGNGSLRKSLLDYASSFMMPTRSHHSRMQLACLLSVADVPPLPLLQEIKKLVIQSSANLLSTTQALMRGVLSDLGYPMRHEVVAVFVEAWLS